MKFFVVFSHIILSIGWLLQNWLDILQTLKNSLLVISNDLFVNRIIRSSNWVPYYNSIQDPSFVDIVTEWMASRQMTNCKFYNRVFAVNASVRLWQIWLFFIENILGFLLIVALKFIFFGFTLYSKLLALALLILKSNSLLFSSI